LRTSAKSASALAPLRSPITRDPFTLLRGIDRRTAAGRRLSDVITGLVSDFGNASPDKIRELASLKIALEAAQSALVAGDTGARHHLIQLGNLVAKREKELRAHRVNPSVVNKKASPSVNTPTEPAKPRSRLSAMLDSAAATPTPSLQSIIAEYADAKGEAKP
jgi:hypothetical protein